MKKIAFFSFIFFNTVLNAAPESEENSNIYFLKNYNLAEAWKNICRGDEKSKKYLEGKDQLEEARKACVYVLDKKMKFKASDAEPSELDSFEKMSTNKNTKFFQKLFEKLQIPPHEKWVMSQQFASVATLKIFEILSINEGCDQENIVLPLEYWQTAFPNEKQRNEALIKALKQRNEQIAEAEKLKEQQNTHIKAKQAALKHPNEVAALDKMLEEKEKKEREERAALKAASGK